MRGIHFESTVWRQGPDGPDGDDVEIPVEGTFTPGVRGRLSGPPENCYPNEPAELEMDVEVSSEEQETLLEEAIRRFGEYGEKWEDEQRAEAALMRREDY